MRRLLIVALLSSTAAAPPSDPAHAPAAHEAPAAAAAESAPAPAPTAGAGRPVLPPFAAVLAQMPNITDSRAWPELTEEAAWDEIVHAKPETRQLARWRYAGSLIRRGMGAEALGVLETMEADDADLALVAPFQLASGAALVMIGHYRDAVEALSLPELEGNSEACAWRVRALAGTGDGQAAARQINCAVPSINGRSPEERKPFTLAAARGAIAVGQGQSALAWLKLFGDQNAEANLLRGKALLASGDPAAGLFRLSRAELSGSPIVQAEARLAHIEGDLKLHRVDPAEGVKQLEAFRYGWRGDEIEAGALRLEYQLALETNNHRAALRSAATLFRFYRPDGDAAPMLKQIQAWLGEMLAPDSGTPLPEAAGLYWDYKELAPAGAEGDALALRLADRLEAAGLYPRAAELLQYQLMQRRQDVAQGPLSVKVATLFILSGDPVKALDTINATEQASYSDAMRFDRKRIQAVALYKLGREAAAMAALDGVPGGSGVRSEIHWRTRNWGSFITENEATLPPPGAMTPPNQAIVLRQAVALAMLNQEGKLQALRARYGAAFKALPSAQAFDLLTQPAPTVDPARISAAMAAIPEASPTGAIGDLLDATTTS
ncbi:hypothetical protein [Sphingomonas sp. TDK1]|uniref:hypothetical protein n=1 Tax=Sphingomonas sp. TDK1 TaxID=453247 RepID=UPI0007D96B3A|nr:hypothetical protein [Sphingomonas sp. TDK1]OAN57310.1 hypothetical protein A7X12_08880 [Sphingomonas sp. TDK1]